MLFAVCSMLAIDTSFTILLTRGMMRKSNVSIAPMTIISETAAASQFGIFLPRIEGFFSRLGEVQEKLNGDLAENIQQCNGVVGKTMYVYGTAADKEEIYGKLNFELDRSNVQINKSVVNAIYGRVCAELRPSNPENSSYKEISVLAAFLRDTIGAFKDKIDNDANNSELVNMDIYTALCKESDAQFVRNGGKLDQGDDLADFDITSGSVKSGNQNAQRHRAAFVACKEKLHRIFQKKDRQL